MIKDDMINMLPPWFQKIREYPELMKAYGAALEEFNNNMKQVRLELGNRVRHQLRIIPELKFFVDDSLDYIEHIDELLAK